MVQILPPVQRRSFSSEIGRELGEGLVSGYQNKKQEIADEKLSRQLGIDLRGQDPETRKLMIASALQGKRSQEIQKLKESEKEKRQQQFQNMISGIYDQEASFTPQQFANSMQNGGFSSRDTDMGQEEKNLHDFNLESIEEDLDPYERDLGKPGRASKRKFPERDIALAAISGPEGANLAKIMQSQNDMAAQEEIEERKSLEKLLSEERQARTKKEERYFKMNEPKLQEIATTERKVNLDSARFSKLENLFNEEDQFPSTLLAALVSKEGQINDTAYSQLSPTAQEAVKLIIDSTSGIKDTYGSRVTNFDLQTYLRKLPSLLTSPEGRRRVIRDLKSINDINQVYNTGIQDIFDEAGGSDKIPFSEAERRFKKKYGKEIQQKMDQFISPEEKIPKGKGMQSKPDAVKHLGKKVRDIETGEIYISDGKEWKLFKG